MDYFTKTFCRYGCFFNVGRHGYVFLIYKADRFQDREFGLFHPIKGVSVDVLYSSSAETVFDFCILHTVGNAENADNVMLCVFM